MTGVFKYVVAAHFLPKYCGIIVTSRVKQKLRGIDGNGKPITFTAEEQMQIRQGLKKLAAEYNKAGSLVQE